MHNDQVLLDYKITVTGTKIKRQRYLNPFTKVNASWTDNFFIEEQIEDVQMITADIPEREFTAMLDALGEMRELMRDPETAKLLMEARFINRLKGNR
jgi:hypothetical protein